MPTLCLCGGSCACSAAAPEESPACMCDDDRRHGTCDVSRPRGADTAGDMRQHRGTS
eukprot:CAMPEP_0204001702 /NCGR_PEP_ID=MMETSP0360-20130528/16377_1 /ASSEMBLY_ACC=CAM_ASM_000342 /TAXON_ID=268821 /ORGANISM="Scrippsiella Hangoei, Strain SHTV-5" /LENGTH=56 /DNA_ID=CAMNT_0050943227 /DNA_START=530 /DNA_END=700 /DNA_ORIENTATION=+